MGFVKLVKNNAYFKKYQTKKRRRREGKTDFKARKNMVKQDKNKYNAHKYRLVVRIQNKRVVVAVVYATIAGDHTMCQALSTELPGYGIPVGLSNYAACYATGLLCARRLLNKLGLEEAFEGVEECDGEEFHIEEEIDEDERRPFKVILDVGLARTTVGAKCFAAMKGAADGGLHVPHSCKRFPGYQPPEEKGAEAQFDAEALKDRIFGKHVSEYMEMMEEEDQQKYESHFSQYIKHGIGADDVEEMYTNAHKKIRESPAHVKKPKKDIKFTINGCKTSDGKNTWTRHKKRSKKERHGRVRAMIARAQQRMLEAAGEEEEEE